MSPTERRTRGRAISSRQLRVQLPRLTISVLVGVLTGLATGWPVAAVIAAAAVFGLPTLFGQTSSSVSIEKIESIASWTEMLQGTLAASAGLSQAIVATAPLSPLPLRGAATRLAGRLSAGMHPRDALLQFADELDDPCADRVVCALQLAVTSRAQRMGDLLAALADSTRDEVALRLRIETSRASVRSGVRTVLVFSVAFAVGLTLLAHPYLAPFDSGRGQVVLAAVGTLYGLGTDLDGRLGPSTGAGAVARASGGRAMTIAVVLGALAGSGCIGVVTGVRATPPTSRVHRRGHEPTGNDWHRSGRGARGRSGTYPGEGGSSARRPGSTVPPLASHPRWLTLVPALAITGESSEGLASKVLVAGGVGLLGPPLLWVAAESAGVATSPLVPDSGCCGRGIRCGDPSCRRTGRPGQRSSSSLPNCDRILCGPGGLELGRRRRNRGSTLGRVSGERRLGGRPYGQGSVQGTGCRTIPVVRTRSTGFGDRRSRARRAVDDARAGRNGGGSNTAGVELEGGLPPSPRTSRCRVCGQRHDGAAVSSRSSSPVRLPPLHRLSRLQPHPRRPLMPADPTDGRSIGQRPCSTVVVRPSHVKGI